MLTRWMYVVLPRRPGVVEVAERSSQSIAVGSTLTPFTRAPTTLLPSFVCHVGPAKWVPIRLPRRS